MGISEAKDSRSLSLMAINLRSWLQNKSLQITIFTIWAAVNSFVFYDTYSLYQHDPKYFYITQMMGSSLCISRATASLIYLNSALVMLPMCRGLLSWSRVLLAKYLSSVQRRLYDHTKGFHTYVGYCLVLSSAVHTIGHLVNNHRFSIYYSYRHPDLNICSKKDEFSYAIIFKTVPGVTGILLIVVMVLMTMTSFKKIRKEKYEVFWYTHHLYIVFFGLYLVHGFGGIIKYQTNLDKHLPGCKLHVNSTLNANCAEEAKFAPNPPEAWKWAIGPLVLFMLDKLYRIINRQGNVEINTVILHEGEVIEIRMRKHGFTALPGQYIRMNCPQISWFQWHAFTITKVPTKLNDEFWVQIKVTGSWTGRLSGVVFPLVMTNETANRIAHSSILTIENGNVGTESSIQRPLLRLYVEGPFGGPCQDVTRYRIGVCVGAGIGVTPFSAVLNHLRDQAQQSGKLGKLEKLHFIWVCRNVTDFRWFLDILYDVYLALQKFQEGVLDCKLFVTRGEVISEKDASLIQDMHEWQRTVLNAGRPNWEQELKSLAKQYERERIGVFFCGPQMAGIQLNKACLTVEEKENVFIYHKETIG